MLTREDFESCDIAFENEFELIQGTFLLMCQTRGLIEHVAQRYADEDEANTPPGSLPF
ncbi:MAG: hypothetical protein H7330_01485 [Hymenobacteraceae bacterium]|nr:hypothetical protein [Hymenobacteraceae bacterium]